MGLLKAQIYFASAGGLLVRTEDSLASKAPRAKFRQWWAARYLRSRIGTLQNAHGAVDVTILGVKGRVWGADRAD